jgi:serine protease Do
MQLIDQAQLGIVQVHNSGRGAGTGIIWRADGTIVTNHHVVPHDDAPIQVHLSDDRVFDAKVIDRNAKLDLAMLKITADNLTAIPIGDSSRLRIGELVFAIGNPWGHRGVATAGIVSGLSTVKLPNSDQTTQHVKSDVHLAPGFSGGPLLDASGTVVGINAMVFGGDLGVCIPSNVVSDWIAELPQRQISLSIELQQVELPDSLRKKEPALAKRAAGLLVVATNLDGRKDSANVLIGDVLLDVDNKPIDDVHSLLDRLARLDARDNVRFNVLRGGILRAVDVDIETVTHNG